MIQDALIYGTTIIIISIIIKSYMIKVAQIDSETQIQRANAYAKAQQVGAIAEAGAWGMGSENSGTGDLNGIIGLLQNPIVQSFLQKNKEK